MVSSHILCVICNFDTTLPRAFIQFINDILYIYNALLHNASLQKYIYFYYISIKIYIYIYIFVLNGSAIEWCCFTHQQPLPQHHHFLVMATHDLRVAPDFASLLRGRNGHRGRVVGVRGLIIYLILLFLYSSLYICYDVPPPPSQRQSLSQPDLSLLFFCFLSLSFLPGPWCLQ